MQVHYASPVCHIKNKSIEQKRPDLSFNMSLAIRHKNITQRSLSSHLREEERSTKLIAVSMNWECGVARTTINMNFDELGAIA